MNQQQLNNKKFEPGLNRRKIGSEGEDLASRFLREQQYSIVERNYRCRLGEIDFIAQDNDTLVFIEVKTRRKSAHGLPQEAVTWSKQRQIFKVALSYLKQNGYSIYNTCIRFDVVSVHPDKRIELIKNAFISDGRYTV